MTFDLLFFFFLSFWMVALRCLCSTRQQQSVGQKRFSQGPGTPQGEHPTGVLSSECILPIPRSPRSSKYWNSVSGDHTGSPKCYREPPREEHADTVYSQLNVFITASWNYTQLFGDLSVALSVQIEHRVSKSRNYVPAYPSAVAGEFSTSRPFTEPKISQLGHRDLGFLDQSWAIFCRASHQGEQILVRPKTSSVRHKMEEPLYCLDLSHGSSELLLTDGRLSCQQPFQ